MDQEGGNRRRSSRLAARGVTTPRTENVKKSIKTAEKPKRSKRKTTEEAIELPESKKTKTENTESSNKIAKAINIEEKVLVIKLVKSDAVVNSPMDVDNDKTNVMPPSNDEQNDKPEVEQNDKPAIEQNDKPMVELNDEPVVEQNDKPEVEQNDEPMVEQNDEPAIEQNDKPAIEQNDKPMVELNDEPVVEQNDQPVVEQIDKPVVEQNDTPVVEKNDTPVVEQNDTPVVEKNDTPVVEENDKPAVDEKTEVPPQDSKEQEVIEKITVVKDENEKVDLSLQDDEKQPEEKEEPNKIKEPEIFEQQNNVSVEEPKKELVVLENMNGKSDEKETVEPVNEIVKNDIGPSVTTKDIVTSNGDKSVIDSEAIEPIKVLHDNKNPVESEVITVKTVTSPSADVITTNNDALIIEEVPKELDEPDDDNVIDSTSIDENKPSVEQSTVVS